MRKKLVMIFSIIILVTLTSCKAWQQNITTDEGEVKEEVCITQQPENENITTKEEEDIMIKTLKYGIKPAEYGLQAGAEGTSFQFFADGSDGHLKAPDTPTVELDSDDPIEIAKYYTNLYNSWQWSGWKATYRRRTHRNKKQ